MSSHIGDICSAHNEKLKIFCHNDEQLICLICQLSKQHKVHECSPVEEAAQQKKAEILNRLESLKKKLKILYKTKTNWEETKTYIQTQETENETIIKKEFEMLHQFLRQEERMRLNELKTEAETKTEVMRRKLETIGEQIKDLSASISEVEKSLKAQNLQFLMEYKQTKARVKCSIQQPECVRDILINTAQHLGSLDFEIWKNMGRLVKHVPVVLDPNTAQYNLSISPDLSRMQCGNKTVRPNNPERCINRMCVLGAAGFTFGKHSWTTEMGYTKNWTIGVVLESIKRKEAVYVKPAEGMWVISLCNGDLLFAEAYPRIKLSMKHKPEKITVELDYNKGKVVFINATDSSTIYTFKGKFTEKIFPYFSLGLPEDDLNQSALTICPVKIKVDVE